MQVRCTGAMVVKQMQETGKVSCIVMPSGKLQGGGRTGMGWTTSGMCFSPFFLVQDYMSCDMIGVLWLVLFMCMRDTFHDPGCIMTCRHPSWNGGGHVAW